MVRGLYIGRFNPFHKGHLEALKYIFSKETIDSLIIGVGSAQESYSLTNPLTGGERIEIIMKVLNKLRNNNSKELLSIPLIDLGNNNLWVSYVISICPSFEIVFSNNPLVKLLFTKARIKVESIPLVNRKQYSGSKIREKIINNEKWEEFVPTETLEYLKKFNFENRLKKLEKKDE